MADPTVTLVSPTLLEINAGTVSPATPIALKIQTEFGQYITNIAADVNGVTVYNSVDGGMQGWYGVLSEVAAPVFPPPQMLTLYSPTGFDYASAVSISVSVDYEGVEGGGE
jgi:hypothetical protein